MKYVRIYQFNDPEGHKCGCGWEDHTFFVVASNKKEAEQLYKDTGGLCLACLVDFLRDYDMYLVKREKR